MPSLYKLSILGLIFFLPLVFFPSVVHPYEYPKFLLLIIGSFLLSCFHIVIIWKKDKILHPFTTTDILILLFLLWLLFVDCVGLDTKVSLLGSEYRFQGFVTYLALTTVYFLMRSTPILKKTLSKFALLSLSILTVITLIDFLRLQLGILVPNFQGRVIGTMGNPNSLGIHLVLLLSLVLFLRNGKGKGRVATDMLICVCVGMAVFITDSRSALMGFVFVIISKVIYLFYKRFGRKALIVGIGIALLGFVIAFNVYSSSTQKRISQWESRSLIWKHAVHAITKNSFTGYGQENYELVFPKDLKLKVDSAHNYLLELGVSGGIPLILLFLFVIFSVLRQKRSLYLKIFIGTFLIVSFFNPFSIATLLLLWGILGFTDS